MVTTHDGQYLEVPLVTDISSLRGSLHNKGCSSHCWSRLAEREGVWVLSLWSCFRGCSRLNTRGWADKEAETEARTHSGAPAGAQIRGGGNSNRGLYVVAVWRAIMSWIGIKEYGTKILFADLSSDWAWAVARSAASSWHGLLPLNQSEASMGQSQPIRGKETGHCCGQVESAQRRQRSAVLALWDRGREYVDDYLSQPRRKTNKTNINIESKLG